MSKKSLRDFGLSTDHLFKQILIGLVVGFILVVLLQGLSFLEASPNLYDIFSMMLVGFSEELLFRGFLFTMIYELSGSRLKAVFIPSIVFGIWHFPVGQSIDQVIGTTIIGLIYAGIRSLYFITDKEIGIIPLSIFTGCIIFLSYKIFNSLNKPKVSSLSNKLKINVVLFVRS